MLKLPDYLFLGSLIFILIYSLRGLFGKQKSCPKCGNLVPKWRKPKDFIQGFGGGWTCSKCGCEIDGNGEVIQDLEEHRKKIKHKLVITIAVNIVIFIVMVGGIFFAFDYWFSPYKYSNNAELCERFPKNNFLREECFYEMAVKNKELAIKNNDVTLCYKINSTAEIRVLMVSTIKEDCLKHFGVKE